MSLYTALRFLYIYIKTLGSASGAYVRAVFIVSHTHLKQLVCRVFSSDEFSDVISAEHECVRDENESHSACFDRRCLRSQTHAEGALEHTMRLCLHKKYNDLILDLRLKNQ